MQLVDKPDFVKKFAHKVRTGHWPQRDSKGKQNQNRWEIKPRVETEMKRFVDPYLPKTIPTSTTTQPDSSSNGPIVDDLPPLNEEVIHIVKYINIFTVFISKLIFLLTGDDSIQCNMLYEWFKVKRRTKLYCNRKRRTNNLTNN